MSSEDIHLGFPVDYATALENILEAPMTGREYAAVLREAAEFFDAHPYLPVPDGAHTLLLYYEHPSPAEIRWLTAIVADEGFKVKSSASGLDLWVKKLTRATLALAIPPLLSKPS